MLIQSKILNIFEKIEPIKIFGEDNLAYTTIIESSNGFYEIRGHGFFKVNKEELIGLKKIKRFIGCELIIIEIKTDGECTVLKLSNNNLITYNIETSFLTVFTFEEVKDDKEYLDWYENDCKLLSNDNYFYRSVL
jgi:hypothetical protein